MLLQAFGAKMPRLIYPIFRISGTFPGFSSGTWPFSRLLRTGKLKFWIHGLFMVHTDVAYSIARTLHLPEMVQGCWESRKTEHCEWTPWLPPATLLSTDWQPAADQTWHKNDIFALVTVICRMCTATLETHRLALPILRMSIPWNTGTGLSRTQFCHPTVRTSSDLLA